MFRRLPGVVAVLVALAACSDQPTAPPTQLDVPIYEHGDPNDDFHFIPGEGEGSHGRLGHLSWVKTGPRSAEFTYVIGFRRSFFGAPNVGYTRCFASVSFGDGTTACPNLTVTYVDAANDWFEARGTFSHTYPGDGPYTANSAGCCRVGIRSPWAHMNNRDRQYVYQAVVNFASAGSAVSGLPALVACPRNGLCQFNVAAAAPGGQTIRWRLANASEWGSGNVQPSGAAVDPTTGRYTWSTTGAALHPTLRSIYSTAVVMETLDGATVTSRTAIDFLIELTDVAANAPPAFELPTPADGSVFTVLSGTTVTVPAQASDPDGDDVTITALGVPAGASFTSTTGNPASGALTFTPSAPGNYVINFVATDSRGLSATPVSFTIVVPANSPPVAVAGGPYSGDEGSSISFDGSGSTDDDGDVLTYTWDFGDGNSGSGATPTHVYADNDTYTGLLTVSDGQGGSDSAPFTVTVNNVAPSVTLGAMSSVLTFDLSTGTGSFTDPGSADTWTGTVDYGDGTVEPLLLNPDNTFALSHAYDDNDDYTVTVSITDDDGDTGTASTVATILNRAPTADATGSDEVVECTDADDGCTEVSLNGAGSSDEDGTVVGWSWSVNGQEVATGAQAVIKLSGVGSHVVTLTVTDDDGDTGATTHTVTIEDTTAPEVSFGLEVTTLWSPNHKLMKVASGIGVTDACDPAGTALAFGVTSNEALNGTGDGNTDSDWWFEPVGDGTYNLWLRAERKGNGTGRVYTVTVTGTDASGNVTEVTGEVSVPHSQGQGKGR